jgi:iron complex transport system substrate-binding protein
MERVVSLLPSITETVSALGFEGRLVGRSHECDFPASVTSLPICTEPKLDVTGTSREIDDRVKRLVRDGLSVYRVYEDTLRNLRPDLILTQSQCEVCAASLGDVEAAVADWVGASPRVVSLAPNTLADVWRDIRIVAGALGDPQRGVALCDALTDRVTGIAERVGRARERPRVACLEWIDPPMGAGNWMPELVALAGAENLFGRAGEHSPWLTWEELRDADPDALVILPCGFDLRRARDEMSALTARPGWSSLRAVRRGRVFLTDGNQYFNRPGPRLADSLEILTEMLHPDAARFGHESRAWERL